MFRLENTVWTSAEYLEYIGNEYLGYLGKFEYTEDKSCTLVELEELLQENEFSLWNYPLNEMEYLVNEVGGNFAIVKFIDNYRICEI